MNERTRSILFVSGQFALLALILFWPEGKEEDNLIELALTWVGLTLTAVGVAVLLLSLVGLGRSLTASPIPKGDAKLVTRGFYKYMRHPIYTGLLTFALGVGLDAGFPQILFVASLFVLINRKARWEEELLLQRYPEYAEYMSKTPRFLPRLKG